MCGNTPRERLEILEPVSEDWHCLVTLLEVSGSSVHILMYVRHIQIQAHL